MSKVGKGIQNRETRKVCPCSKGEFSEEGGATTITSASTFSEMLMESKTSGFQLFLSYLLPSTL